jgi:arylsulfatase A-like enzyme
VDLVATACTLAGADTAELDGQSLAPVWRGEVGEVSRPEPLCWEHYGHAAIRQGQWKLVRAGAQAPWELYDISTDRIEQHDLAATQPDRVATLTATWQRWAARCGVLTPPIKSLPK